MNDPCRQTAIRSLITSTSLHTVVLQHMEAPTPDVPMVLLLGALQILGVTRDEIAEAVETLELQYIFELSPNTVGGVS